MSDKKKPDNVVLGTLGDDPDTIVQAAEMISRLVDCPVCGEAVFDLGEHMRAMKDEAHLMYDVMET